MHTAAQAARRPPIMPATIYPRINPSSLSDPRTGEPRAPLRFPATGGFAASSNATITSANATLAAAAAVTVTAGAPVPDAPGLMLPFRVEDVSTDVHLRIAFINDPTSTVSAFALPSEIRVAVVPAIQIPAAGSITLNGGAIEGLRQMLKVGDTVSTKTVPGGYAHIDGEALSGNVFSVTLSFTGSVPSGAVNATWYLVVRCASDLWVTLGVTETAGAAEAEAGIPWIHVPSTEASVDLGGPFTPGVPTTGGTAGTVSNVRNFGTGTLNVLASVTADPSGSDQVSIVAATAAAAASTSVPLDFSAGDGVASLDVAITSNDPTPLVGDYHNSHIAVTATAEVIGVADTVLVLDASGSMMWRPDGTALGNAASADPAQRRRWDNLVTAVNHLVDGYISFLNNPSGSPSSRLGIAVFPDVLDKTGNWPQRASTMVASAPVSTGGLNVTITNALASAGAALEGAGLTPMGEGIGVAMGTTAGSSGMYHADAAAHRRWMVLMTDGMHNAGTIHPNQFFQADAIPDFLDKEVRMYSIGYTTAAGGTAVDLLQDLADNGLNPVDGVALEESQFAQTPLTAGFEKDLTDTFMDALAVTLGLAPTFDPPGVLTSNAPIAIHEFNVSPFDTGVGVFVDWATRSADRIQVALISPRCERFDEKALSSSPELGYRELEGYAHAYISDKALKGESPDKHRYGTWKLELRLNGRIEIDRPDIGDVRPVRPVRPIPGRIAKDSEPYKFNIFNRSGLRVSLGATRSRWGTGESVELVARLRANGAPVTGARLVATLDAPSADYGTLLANATVDGASFERANATIKKNAAEQLGTWAAKAIAFAQSNGPIAVSRTRQPIEFHETKPGVYKAKTKQLPISGDYSIHLVMTGFVGDVPYRRERAVTVNVEARPDPKSTIVTYDMTKDGRLTVIVVPRDAFDNAVVFDPAGSPRLGIDVRGGKAHGGVANRFDGSYTQTFEIHGTEPPIVTVTWDGDPVVVPHPAPHPKWIEWLEHLVDSDHTNDPKKALGPVEGPDDPYAEIQPGGHITLADRHPFQASYLAVFTHADSHQAYRVYVRPVNEKRWVPIGGSWGPTQVFQVPRRMGPIRNVRVVHAHEEKGSAPVLLQGVGYTRRRGHSGEH